jgi:uncharacterized protein (DUF2147 family)
MVQNMGRDMGRDMGNMMKSGSWAKMCVAGCLGALLLAGVAPAVAAGSVAGTWRLSSGKVTIRVSPCGGQNICATITGLAQPLNKKGQPKLDKENPNPALRSRRIIGLQVVNGMKPSGADTWSGRIYNADDGRTYSGSAKLSGNTLTISACILGGLACQKKKFVRVN